MPDGFLTTSDSPLAHPDLPDALEQAAGAIARLDQALDCHPLLPAFLYRTRLDAVLSICADHCTLTLSAALNASG